MVKKGYKQSEEHKRKIGLANAQILHGRKLSKDHCKNISNGRLKLKQKLGYLNSPETKRRLSLALKGRKCPWNKKTIRGANKGSFKKGHEVPELWREAVRKNRINQIFPMKDSSIERKIQKFLSLLHVEFYTHKYISEINHSYQCDIFIPKQKGIKQKMIIETDGCYWHGCSICNFPTTENIKKAIERDKIRTKELTDKGFKVLRLWEHDIKKMELNNFREIIFSRNQIAWM